MTFSLKDVCVWDKVNASLGALYRSQHELVFVFKHGGAAHADNLRPGSGRVRSNLWRYGEPAARRRSDAGRNKPLGLIAEAIKDGSRRGGLVLGCGSGMTTLLAADRTGRRARVIESDPGRVDAIIRRFVQRTGKEAVSAATGECLGAREVVVRTSKGHLSPRSPTADQDIFDGR
jgi:DNA modification methylase